MSEIKEIKSRCRTSSEKGVFHDSRSDSRVLARGINMLIEKVNELVKSNNDKEERIKSLEDRLDRAEKVTDLHQR